MDKLKFTINDTCVLIFSDDIYLYPALATVVELEMQPSCSMSVMK